MIARLYVQGCVYPKSLNTASFRAAKVVEQEERIGSLVDLKNRHPVAQKITSPNE